MTDEYVKEIAYTYFNIPTKHLKYFNKIREINFVYAKMCIVYTLHDMGKNHTEIAKQIGMSRATVIGYLKSKQDRLSYDKIFNKHYKQFQNTLFNGK